APRTTGRSDRPSFVPARDSLSGVPSAGIPLSWRKLVRVRSLPAGRSGPRHRRISVTDGLSSHEMKILSPDGGRGEDYALARLEIGQDSGLAFVVARLDRM